MGLLLLKERHVSHLANIRVLSRVFLFGVYAGVVFVRVQKSGGSIERLRTLLLCSVYAVIYMVVLGIFLMIRFEKMLTHLLSIHQNKLRMQLTFPPIDCLLSHRMTMEERPCNGRATRGTGGRAQVYSEVS